jgi:hypothetical protein
LCLAIFVAAVLATRSDATPSAAYFSQSPSIQPSATPATSLDEEALTDFFGQRINMSSTAMIYVDHDRSTVIPTQLGLLTALTSMILVSNDVYGGLPSEVGLLTYLENLHLAGKKIN